MLRITVYANEYIQSHPTQEVRAAVSKVMRNTRTLWRGINIAVQDKFDTSKRTNPYYDDLCSAGIEDCELPILADFFNYVYECETKFNSDWIKQHPYAGRFNGIKPVIKGWQSDPAFLDIT
jgi:hypothetical protein